MQCFIIGKKRGHICLRIISSNSRIGLSYHWASVHWCGDSIVKILIFLCWWKLAVALNPPQNPAALAGPGPAWTPQTQDSMLTFLGLKHFCLHGLLLPLKKIEQYILQLHWYKDKHNQIGLYQLFGFKSLLKKNTFRLYFSLAFCKDYLSFLPSFILSP